jgi:cytochrome c553
MTRFIVWLSIALAIEMAGTASGEDISSGTPPLPSASPPIASATGLEEIMGRVQLRHLKLWYAIKANNWDLVNYEAARIKDSLSNAGVLYGNIPAEYVAAAETPLSALQDLARQKDAAQSERRFMELTAACNGCHKAGRVGFILIKPPELASSPFRDQEFMPRRN